MNEELIRSRIHQAVDAYGASTQDDPCLAQRILSRTTRKEAPRMKKLSTGAIIAIVLMLLSVTAVAVGLTVEEMWQKSFEKMNTTGMIHNLSDESQAEITMDEAIAIARQAIQDKYATPDAELDAMGVYPTYAARGWDGKTDEYPSRWDIWFSSRTDADLDIDTLDYGPTGEYRVYINAETKEITFCNWYTTHFWDYAQRLWDAGLYEEVYNRSTGNDFYTQSLEMQSYWRNLLTGKGYAVLPEEDIRYKLLLGGAIQELTFGPLDRIADNADPQVTAAWEAVQQQYGYDASVLKKYAYVATRPDWQTGTEDVCIHYSYELQWDWLDKELIESHCNLIFSDVSRCGLFMVSFEPGTTQVVSVIQVTYSATMREEPVTEGKLLERTDWSPEDLAAFDLAFTEMDKAYDRMEAAGATLMDKSFVKDEVMLALGGNPQYYEHHPDYDTAQWFSDEGAHVSPYAPTMDPDEVEALYGIASLFWPLEVQYDQLRQFNLHYALPQEGEMTQAEATALALEAVREAYGQQALDKLGDYVIGVSLRRETGDYGKEITRWSFYIVDAPDWTMGWYVGFIGENYEDYGSRCITVYDINEHGFG